ncbi:MAG: CPBP family intramembrane metalloprotease [Planctomycetes bacterium]|nr:CPBP family intramembrane metalloprotease [Planctomycetota bacterium]
MPDRPSHHDDPDAASIPAASPIAPVGQARPITTGGLLMRPPHPMHLWPASRPATWLDLGMFLVGLVASLLVLAILATLITWLAVDLDRRMLTVLLIPIQALLWLGVVALILKQRRQPAASLGWVRVTALDLPLGLAATAAAFTAFFLSVGILALVWPAGFEDLQNNQQAITEMLPPLHPALLIGLQIVVGIYEELIFRGFLLTRLRRALGCWWLAAGISSALFALPHIIEQRPVAAIPLFGVGLAFCLFTIWRRSLLPAIIGHALFNSIMLMGIYLTNRDWT